MLSKQNFNFKYKRLFRGKEKTGFEVIPDKTEKYMYRVKWPDGKESEDYYNLSWAKQHCVNQAIVASQKVGESPLEARTEEI